MPCTICTRYNWTEQITRPVIPPSILFFFGAEKLPNGREPNNRTETIQIEIEIFIERAKGSLCWPLLYCYKDDWSKQTQREPNSGCVFSIWETECAFKSFHCAGKETNWNNNNKTIEMERSRWAKSFMCSSKDTDCHANWIQVVCGYKHIHWQLEFRVRWRKWRMTYTQYYSQIRAQFANKLDFWNEVCRRAAYSNIGLNFVLILREQ